MYLLLTVFSDLWSESEIKEIYLLCQQNETRNLNLALFIV